MEQRLNIDDLLKKNVGVDKEAFEEIEKYLKELKENGVEEEKYNLSSPFSESLLKTKKDLKLCKHFFSQY
jgi:hypothetical protein